MSARIDHAALAHSLVGLADHSYGQIEHRNGAVVLSQSVEALMVATEAQVHAVLALVEQQRIANLIALGQSIAGDGSRPFRHLIMVPMNEYDMMPVAEIREALGLS